MRWQELTRFRDPSVPKLNNLRRAAAAGLRVPPTWWVLGRQVDGPSSPPSPLSGYACIVRSGAPTEDTTETSNAGQLLSVAVRDPAEFEIAAARVVAALPKDSAGEPLGAAFV